MSALNANGIQTCKDYLNNEKFLLEYLLKVSEEDKQDFLIIKKLLKQKLEEDENKSKKSNLTASCFDNSKNIANAITTTTTTTIKVNKISGIYHFYYCLRKEIL